MYLRRRRQAADPKRSPRHRRRSHHPDTWAGARPPRCRGDGIAYGVAVTVSGLRLGVDVGGTFTDVVAVDGEGRVGIEKVHSTPQDQSARALAGWQALDVPAGRVAMFAHGTTVATNALLERLSLIHI